MADTELSMLAKAIENQTRFMQKVLTKTPASQTTATPLHGLGNIFGCGVEREVLTAHIQPRGILSVLPRRPNLSEDPTYSTITGFTAATGTALTLATVCDDAPAGYMKNCNLTARFGLVRRDTQTIDALEVIRKVNRGDFTDLILYGQILGLQDFTPGGLDQNQILNIYTMAEMVGAGVQAERLMNTGVWQSTLAAEPYFPGLDSQIATAQVDADSNQACPALDSDVKDFDYADVCGTERDIVEYMSMMERYLRWNAESAGLDPVEYVIAMHPNLWHELSACWPCRYQTNRCTDFGGTYAAVINDDNNVRMRDDMRNRMVIPINGTEYPVVVDTGVVELTNITDGNLGLGQYASQIYFVPLRVRSNAPGRGLEVTTLQYLDYRAATPEVSMVRDKINFWWTDNGLWSWSLDDNAWCYKLKLRCEPRVVLRTPQLAGRIQHVMYEPLQHLREPDPDSPYHYDGGVSVRGSGTRYAVWM